MVEEKSEKSKFISQESSYTGYMNRNKKLKPKNFRLADFICPTMKLSKREQEEYDKPYREQNCCSGSGFS